MNTSSKVAPLSGGGVESKGETILSPAIRKMGSKWQALKPQGKAVRVQYAMNHARLQANYFVRSEPVSIRDATVVRSLPLDLPDMKDHMIITGNVTSDIYTLVLTMRSRKTKIPQPIVLLNPQPPDEACWNRVNIFPQLVYVKGSALNADDLVRAGVMSAKNAIVLARSNERGDAMDSNMGSAANEAVLDADTIFSFQNISALNPGIHVVAEIVNHANVSFLSPDMSGSEGRFVDDPLTSPQFASGAAYTASMMDTLACQAFYNPHIVTTIQQLVAGSDPELTSAWDSAWRAAGNTTKLVDSNVYQIPVPEQFRGNTYGSLVEWLLLKKDIVPMGLLRGRPEKLACGPRGNRRPYVYTNPSSEIALESYDLVYILAQDPPEDLLVRKSKDIGEVIQTLIKARKDAEGVVESMTGGGPLRGGRKGGLDDESIQKLVKKFSSVVSSEMKSEVQGLKSQVEGLKNQLQKVQMGFIAPPPIARIPPTPTDAGKAEGASTRLEVEMPPGMKFRRRG